MTAWTPKRPQNVAYLDLTGSHAFKVLKGHLANAYLRKTGQGHQTISGPSVLPKHGLTS